MLRHHGEEYQIFAAAVDQTVAVPHGAVVAAAGTKQFFRIIAERLAGAGEDPDDLATGFMDMGADRCAGRQQTVHDFVGFIGIYPGAGPASAALETGNHGFRNAIQGKKHDSRLIR